MGIQEDRDAAKKAREEVAQALGGPLVETGWKRLVDQRSAVGEDMVAETTKVALAIAQALDWKDGRWFETKTAHYEIRTIQSEQDSGTQGDPEVFDPYQVLSLRVGHWPNYKWAVLGPVWGTRMTPRGRQCLDQYGNVIAALPSADNHYIALASEREQFSTDLPQIDQILTKTVSKDLTQAMLNLDAEAGSSPDANQLS